VLSFISFLPTLMGYCDLFLYLMVLEGKHEGHFPKSCCITAPGAGDPGRIDGSCCGD
jgi:hypothetical protein